MKEQETRMDALEVKLSSQSAQQHSIVFGEWFNCTIDSLLVSCNLDSQTELIWSMKVVPENNVFSCSAWRRNFLSFHCGLHNFVLYTKYELAGPEKAGGVYDSYGS